MVALQRCSNEYNLILYVASFSWKTCLFPYLEISVGNDKAFGRGLFIVDPE